MRPKVIVGLEDWTLTGPCIFAERLTRELSNAGWDARVLLTESHTKHVQEKPTLRARPNDIKIEDLPAGYNDSWGMRWDILIRYLEEQAPCIYIMLSDWRNNIIAPRLSNRVYLIGLIQADYELEYNQASRLGHHWNAIVAVSDILQFSLVHRIPHLAPRAVTIRNAVPALDRIPEKPQSSPLCIAYSGELRYGQKRLGDLVKIAFELEARKIPYQLSFIGDGPMRSELEEQTRALIANGNVQFLGRLTSPELLLELEKQHVFVLTSEFEGLSIALLEAMSRGCVPVVSDLATQSLVIKDGVNALCAPISDIGTFADHLGTLAENPALLQKLAEAAFQSIIDGAYRVEDMLNSYLQLFEKIDTAAQAGKFVRWRGRMLAPPEYVGNVGILPGYYLDDRDYVNHTPMWPNAPTLSDSRTKKKTLSSTPATVTGPVGLKDYTVIVASPWGQISGVDIFSGHLVRQLRKRGINAKILGERVLNDRSGLALPDDIPNDSLEIQAGTPWFLRWPKIVSYLESQGPCIYLPNYDFSASSVCPQLSNQVKVIGIAHSDDPAHYDHMIRLRDASNAIVGVSQAITEHIERMSPGLKTRLHTIPYGVELPPSRPARSDTDESSPLRIVYVGRLVNYQKRVNDLIEIAQGLESRQIPFRMTIVGDGAEYDNLQAKGHELIQKGRLHMAGKMSNEEVPEVLRQNDVFLLTSYFEGCSVSLLEAMANGAVPVVSAIRSGVPELIREGENGLLAPVGNIEHFVNQLSFLYHHPEQRNRMSKAAYETIRDNG